MQNFISENGNFLTSTEVEDENENELPLSLTIPKGPSKATGLNDHTKLVDIGSEIRKDISNMDGIDGRYRINSITLPVLERAFQAFQGNVHVLEATLEDNILKHWERSKN